MHLRVLGPLEGVGEDGATLPIAGYKERTMFAHLVARAGLVVSVDDLIYELWAERPPRTAEKTLGPYMSRIRRSIEPRPADACGIERQGSDVEVARISEPTLCSTTRDRSCTELGVSSRDVRRA